MKLKPWRKKGDAPTDVLFIFIILAVVVLGFISATIWFSGLNTQIQKSSIFPDNAKVMIDGTNDRLPTLFDNLVLFIFFGLWLAGIVTVFLIPTESAFFIFSVLMFFAPIVMIGALANIIKAMEQNVGTAPYMLLFPKTTWLFNNGVALAIIVFASMAIVLYGKFRSN